MKKILQITIGIIALGFIVIIAKNTLFTSADEKWYNEGWNAHEKGDYNTAIFYFNRLDKAKYPDVYVGLGSSYMNTGQDISLGLCDLMLMEINFHTLKHTK